jgi:hypothetical protein
MIDKSEQAEALLVCRDSLGLDWTESQILYLERVILGFELVGTGRLAAHSVDVVVRMAATFSRGDNVAHAEIGVLSGSYAGILALVGRGIGKKIQQTLIDPLDGYYGESTTDALTLSDISESNVRRNMALAGCSEQDFRILKGLSTDSDIVRDAGEQQYDTILIDGDHSYDGVCRDIANYGPMLKSDGLLVLDDYGNPAWPGVGQAVDEAVSTGSLRVVAVVSKTAIAEIVSSTEMEM